MLEEQAIRIYMVDDEIRSIQYVQKILAGQGAACKVVGSATSALAALREIPQIKPDIVLADINMPGMNGLDMVAELKKLEHTPIIFLLTAYKEFEFAKRGLQLGVAGYLLKHEITADQLLREFRAQLQTARVDREKAHVFAERNLRRFLLQEDGASNDFPPEHRKSRGYFLALLAPAPTLAIPVRRRQEPVLDCRRLEAVPCPAPLECRNVIPLAPGRFCAFFNTRLTGDIREAQLEAAAALRKEAAAQGCRAACFLSPTVDNFFALPAQYEDMRWLADSAFVLGADTHFYSEVPCCMAGVFDLRQIGDVDLLLSQGQWDEAQKTLLEFLFRAATWGDEQYTAAVETAWRTLRDLAASALPGDKQWGPTVFAHSGEVEDWFTTTLQRLRDQIGGKGNGDVSPKTAKAIVYIHVHYAENISVLDIASAVGLSEGHLRKLFRQELDVTPVDYLSDYRIDRAKQLLATGEYRVVDVYRTVGFTSSQYFSNVFKKRVGISPNGFIAGGAAHMDNI